MLPRDLRFTFFLNQRSHSIAHTLFKDEHADLLKYPPLDPSRTDQLTIGDMHGNALKFIHFLIRHQIIQMNKMDYNRLIKIYSLPTEELSKKHLAEFKEILSEMVILKNSPFIRLLGDELADRGSNDYFTLLLLEKIIPHISLEILLSNHSLEFIAVYEKGLKEFTSDLHGGQAASLINLGVLVKKNLVSRTEIENLIQTVYQPQLKLLSYTLDKTRQFITIYSHAPIGLSTIQELAKLFEIPYFDKHAADLAKTIDEINLHFSTLIKEKKIVTTSHLNECHFDAEHIPLNLPILRTTWARGYLKQDFPKKSNGHYDIYYVHGHDGKGVVEPRYENQEINLDNNFGKSPDKNQGKYYVLFSPNFPLSDEEKKVKEIRRSERLMQKK